ncbi:glycosyltransferase [Massilia glaciei]|uniref:Glycosyltransferase n=1 Tax=Massilia glaciei TaxID=1524097 RepID=A0A2U2HJN1_9BURK|nr:glycosyltransferase [Massilia glaciei]PWF47662.1 glycosyltransferase [Massilia glaciei]
MVKRVLMIAFHYPPMRGGSGIQRTLTFARGLPRHGWEPLVLSVNPRAYLATGDDQLAEGGCTVQRSFSLDAGRDLAVRGRYPGLLALPDRWSSWWLSAVPAALRMIRRHRPSAIWSTYPIATAHLVGLSVQRMSGLPWVADQRDPMIEDGYPADPRTRRLHCWIESRAVARGAAVVCTTPGALAACRARFPAAPEARFELIENGYNEDSFAPAPQQARAGAPFTLLHSGLVYPSERDPGALFCALATLRDAGRIAPGTLRVLLRASGHDEVLMPMIARHRLGGIVELGGALPYREALAEMQAADGLLLLQAANCNAQIPAKLYEYLRARRPILALTDAAGDTAGKLRACGIDTIAALDSANAIAPALLLFMRLAGGGAAPVASAAIVAAQSRAARTAELAQLFDRITVAS